jgi:hypothetical protein
VVPKEKHNILVGTVDPKPTPSVYSDYELVIFGGRVELPFGCRYRPMVVAKVAQIVADGCGL